MSLVGDVIDRVLFPNREIHVIPVLDGAFSPNQRLDEARATRQRDRAARRHGVRAGRRALRVERRHDLALHRSGLCRARRVRSPAGFGRRASPGRPTAACSLASLASGLCALSSGGEIARHGWKRRAGEPIACPASVTVADDGTIYATEGSRANAPELWLADLMQNRAPSGRLIACDPRWAPPACAPTDSPGHRGPSSRMTAAKSGSASRGRIGLTALSRSETVAGLSSRTTPAIPRASSRGAAGDYWMAFFGLRTQLTEFVLRERAFCEAMMRTVPPRTLDRPDARWPLQLSRADADRPHQETRHTEALGARRAPTASSHGSTRRARRPRACTAALTGEFTASPASVRSARACSRPPRGAIVWSSCRRRELNANQG